MLEELEAAIDTLTGFDFQSLTDTELDAVVARFPGLVSRLQAAATTATGVWDARRVWRRDGCHSAAGRLSVDGHCAKRTARELLGVARLVRDLPAVAQAWAAAEIHTDHVRTIGQAHNHRTHDRMVDDQKKLVDYGRTDRRFDDFEAHIREWQLRADPDGADQETDEQMARNRASSVPASDGMWLGAWQLDPIGGLIVDTSLREVYDELFRAEWAAGVARYGAAMTVDKMERTHPQRLAAALVEMALAFPFLTKRRVSASEAGSQPGTSDGGTHAGAEEPAMAAVGGDER